MIEIANTGKYDAVFFDYWQDEKDVLRGHRTLVDQQKAWLAIVRGIREHVHPDFLLLGNCNANTMPLTASYMNGAMMENPTGVPPTHKSVEMFLMQLE